MADKQPLGPNQLAWIEALESGKYKQGQGAMRDDDAHCCLAVGCVVANIPAIQFPSGRWAFGAAQDSGTAPIELVEHLSLHGDCGDTKPVSGKALTLLNDHGKSFAEIAAIIRSDPSVYFKEPK